jgi:hypothetical protein
LIGPQLYEISGALSETNFEKEDVAVVDDLSEFIASAWNRLISAAADKYLRCVCYVNCVLWYW